MNTAFEKKKFRILPAYGWLPIIGMAVTHLTVYYGTKLINSGMPHHDLSLPFEAQIPFAPEWTIIYVLTFLFWVGGMIFTAWQKEELCYKLSMAAMISYLMCAVIFLVLPTTIERPEITGTMYYDRLLRAMYDSDIPTNVFPSMHCMMSYLIFRGMTKSPGMKKGYMWAAGILVVLISASTVFVRQHYFVDTVAGIVLGEIALQISCRTNLWQLLNKLNKKLLHC